MQCKLFWVCPSRRALLSFPIHSNVIFLLIYICINSLDRLQPYLLQVSGINLIICGLLKFLLSLFFTAKTGLHRPHFNGFRFQNGLQVHDVREVPSSTVIDTYFTLFKTPLEERRPSILPLLTRGPLHPPQNFEFLA